MESAKGPSKSVATRKFILLYVLSLLVIIPVVYFSFNTPASLFKKSIQQYKTAETAEGQLQSKTDAITTYINKVIETDRSYQLAVSIPDKEKFKESLGQYTNEITTALQDLENDSANRRSDFSRRNANNYLFMFRNFLEYRDAFSNDFTALESRKDLPLQFKIALDSLRSYQIQRESLKAQLTAALSKTTASGTQIANNANTEAAIRTANEKIDDLQGKLRQSQTDLTNCNQQKSSLSQVATQQTVATITQQQMASLLTDAGKKIYTQALQGKNFKGGTIEQRGFFTCAKQIFEEAKSHAASADIDEYLKNIDVQIKKLSY